MNGTRVSRNVFKLFLSVAAAALLTLCVVMLVGCGKKSTGAPPSGETYYLYDEEDGTFDEREKIFIDGEKCVISVEGVEGMKNLDVDGKIEYGEGNSITGSCGMIVSKLSDILSKEGLEELYDDLGVSSFEMKSEANIKLEFEGWKLNNFVVVTKQSFVIKGFEGLLSGLNCNDSSDDIEVYCIKGQTPDRSVPITFDFDGGTLNGKSSVVIYTDSDGKYTFPEGTPQRDGYVFRHYMTRHGILALKDGDTAIWSNGAISDDVIAIWAERVVVTLDINSSEYKVDGDSVLITGKNMLVNIPTVVPVVADPTTRFKGWYCDSEIMFDVMEQFESDITITAEWYDANKVNSYNNSLHSKSFNKKDSIIVHFRPTFYNENDMGGYGGSIYTFNLYGMTNGVKDSSKKYGTDGGSLWHSDESGRIQIIENVYSAFSGKDELYLEILEWSEVIGGFKINKSDFDRQGTHIFIDENNAITYRTRW